MFLPSTARIHCAMIQLELLLFPRNLCDFFIVFCKLTTSYFLWLFRKVHNNQLTNPKHPLSDRMKKDLPQPAISLSKSFVFFATEFEIATVFNTSYVVRSTIANVQRDAVDNCSNEMTSINLCDGNYPIRLRLQNLCTFFIFVLI